MVSNCTVQNGEMGGLESVGGVAGFNAGRIEGCWVTGRIYNPFPVISGLDFGGIAGDNHGTISLCRTAVDISGGNDIGGIAGFNVLGGTITHCSVTGTMTGTGSCGGIVGRNIGTTFISYCSADVIVSAESSGGGISGSGSGSNTIEQCFSRGLIEGELRLGGLSGTNDGSIANSYSTCDVIATGDFIGGLVGRNSNDGTLVNCYSSGLVSGVGDSVGGFIGKNDGVIMVNDSFWDVDTSGLSNMCGSEDFGSGCNDGSGRTTAQMQMEATFTGWDFVGEIINGSEDIWAICEGTNTPKLAWQEPLLGDWVCPDGVEMSDFGYLSGHWMEQDCQTSDDCAGTDLDLSSDVGPGDLLLWLANWMAGI